MTEQGSPEDPVITPVTMTSEPDPRPASEETPKRSMTAKLFAVSPWDVVRLVLLSILVGYFLLALDFSADSQGVDILGAIWDVVQTILSALWWIVKNFWKPLLAGAAVVLPVWLIWRLVSLPFRK